MRPVLLPTLICTFCLVFLSACGSSQGVLTGDFTELQDSFNGVEVELTYFYRTLQEPVVVGRSVIKDGTVKMNLSFDEDVPRLAFLSFNDQERSRFVGRSVLIEKDANYTVEIFDEQEMWFAIHSDGQYSHILELPLEDELTQRELRAELRDLFRARDRDSDDTTPPTDVEYPEEVPREPSEHAKVLDWENMDCEDYADDFVAFWDRRIAYADQQEGAAIREVRQQLDDFHRRMYDQRLQDILYNSSDPVERLLVLESHIFLELEQRIPILQELLSELPTDVAEERVKPELDRLLEEQQRRQNNAALILGTNMPSIDLTLLDHQEIPLSSILEKNQVVVLDLWDNYCRSCIRAFQKYRSYYSEYADLGFEVVSLSFEGTRADWEEKSKELDLPWVNAFAPDGYDGALSTLLGVRQPRGNFVLDSAGCILKRDLTPDELLDFLGARLGS